MGPGSRVLAEASAPAVEVVSFVSEADLSSAANAILVCRQRPALGCCGLLRRLKASLGNAGISSAGHHTCLDSVV